MSDPLSSADRDLRSRVTELEAENERLKRDHLQMSSDLLGAIAEKSLMCGERDTYRDRLGVATGLLRWLVRNIEPWKQLNGTLKCLECWADADKPTDGCKACRIRAFLASPVSPTAEPGEACYCNGGTNERHPDGSICPGSVGGLPPGGEAADEPITVVTDSDNIHELAALVREAGGTMRLYGRPLIVARPQPSGETTKGGTDGK